MLNNLYDEYPIDCKPKVQIKGNIVMNKHGDVVCSVGCLEAYFSNQLTPKAKEVIESYLYV